MDWSSNYLLAGGRAELDRLRQQAPVWEDDAEALFDQIPVRAGWECIDVGCGGMGVLRPLRERVGPSGRVLGIDADESFVNTGVLTFALIQVWGWK